MHYEETFILECLHYDKNPETFILECLHYDKNPEIFILECCIMIRRAPQGVCNSI